MTQLAANGSGTVGLPVAARTSVTSSTDNVNATHITAGDVSIGGTVWAGRYVSNTRYTVSDESTKTIMGELSVADAKAVVCGLPILVYQFTGAGMCGSVENDGDGVMYGVSANMAKIVDPRLTLTTPDGVVVFNYEMHAVCVARMVQHLEQRLDRMKGAAWSPPVSRASHPCAVITAILLVVAPYLLLIASPFFANAENRYAGLHARRSHAGDVHAAALVSLAAVLAWIGAVWCGVGVAAVCERCRSGGTRAAPRRGERNSD